MSFQMTGPLGLDYEPCRYGASRVTFRGPAQSLHRPYAAFLGGTETYGKFIERPFPALLRDRLALSCVNLGCVNAGHDLYLHDPSIMEIVSRARVCVLQIGGAQNMSNRYYTVHPRRNDRFVKASNLMRQIFRDVDFTEFIFTRHMLESLAQFAPARFQMLRDELQDAWVARTRLLADRLDGRVILLWFADRYPPLSDSVPGLGPDPLFITREMIESLRPDVADIVEVATSAAVKAAGTDGMIFPAGEQAAAATLPGPKAHLEVAARLLPALTAYA
ncbi:DUF6473 family protein [Lutimaribacter sp. EGI FJ00015]|uniref:DUF6473 family protein n=1 Tax=Lutimaribacter degradans TaxID=2945989 RepID=A0ACC5ZWM7_9RHOB|nr:DUF6473 family protein [Lutimaribacter sp. EGI FJ00013]MCM2562712.1 DUF6473 family protein [Lutimaribacter sp. EGI FJ00013]MCO0613869.1 DUF6473 family protein [Lutimaribacter sp. EGI FJ00015]MCO0636648.1 DUF6473 family protein [Lutimaribacter sp. EGI FJ00014]